MNTTDNVAELLQGKRLLIYDFDGTIADTTPLHAAAFDMVLTSFNITINYPKIAGLKTVDAMRKCLGDAGLVLSEKDIELLVKKKQQYVRQMIKQGLLPLPGVNDFLMWAKPRFQIAMVTSGSRDTVSLALKTMGYIDCFETVICSEDVVLSKPHPSGFLLAAKRARVTPSVCLIFEDSDIGLEAAYRAGIEAIDVRQMDFVTLLKNI